MKKITNPIISLIVYTAILLWSAGLILLPAVVLKACYVYLMG